MGKTDESFVGLIDIYGRVLSFPLGIHDGTGIPVEFFSFPGQSDPPACLFKQGKSQVIFQFVQGLGQAGLGNHQFLCRFRQMAPICYFYKIYQL